MTCKASHIRLTRHSQRSPSLHRLVPSLWKTILSPTSSNVPFAFVAGSRPTSSMANLRSFGSNQTNRPDQLGSPTWSQTPASASACSIPASTFSSPHPVASTPFVAGGGTANSTSASGIRGSMPEPGRTSTSHIAVTTTARAVLVSATERVDTTVSSDDPVPDPWCADPSGGGAGALARIDNRGSATPTQGAASRVQDRAAKARSCGSRRRRPYAKAGRDLHQVTSERNGPDARPGGPCPLGVDPLRTSRSN